MGGMRPDPREIGEMEGMIASFVRGYLSARGQAGALLATDGGAIQVSYRQPFNREREWFVWSADPAPPLASSSQGAWVTIFHRDGAPRPAWLPGAFAQIASEHFMSATLPLKIPQPPVATARRLQPGDLHQLQAVAGILPPGGAADDVAYFAAWVGDQLAAWGRFGTGAEPDIVIDSMVTLPQYRRRGLARSILVAMDADAWRRGWRRMLLIASQDGRSLYESVGFEQVAAVSVFGYGP